jgi:hypothetical protein
MSTEAIDALIVRNLLDLERARERLQNHIQIDVGAQIDNIIDEWVKEKNEWFAELDFNADKYRFAPETWRVPGSDRGEDKFRALFKVGCGEAGQINGQWDNEFWLTQLCGLGPGPVGFRWKCEEAEVGTNKTGLKKFLNECGIVQEFKSLGFEFEEKSGTFFRPFLIDKEVLAAAIEGNNLEDAFEPMRTALSAVEKSWKKFDNLITRAIETFKK